MATIALTPVARRRVRMGRPSYWVGALVLHKGHPPIYQCGHKHSTREDARDCAETYLFVPHDSVTGEEINAAIARATRDAA